MITKIDGAAALVLIDFQKSNVGAELAHPVHDIIANANLLIAAFHNKQLPVVAVNVNPLGAAWTKVRAEKPMVPHSEIKQVIAEAAMFIERTTDITEDLQLLSTDIYLTKHTWNAFFETTLHTQLLEKGITQIVLAGISTSIGVEGTARAASELGYNIAFATDAMTDKVAAAHVNSLQYIFPRIGESGTAEEIITELCK